MNTPSRAIAEPMNDSPGVAPAVVSLTRPMYWSVRRELWENRSIYFAPLAVAAVFLLGFLISTVHLRDKMQGLSALDPAHQRAAIAMPYDMGAGLLMLTAMVVGAFYCLDALYGERRDRSILFWKSLPVSDVTTVAAKASIPLVILPLLTFIITLAMHLTMLLVSSAVLLGSGASVALLWTQLGPWQMSLLLLYHLITVHALWPAPLYGWLLLVSAWARRAPFVWAILPPAAIVVVERVAFNTAYFAKLLGGRLSGSGVEALTAPGTLPMDPMTHLTPVRFLSSSGLWFGLAITAMFLAAAVRLRRNRGPI